jgi:large subunit ribosomal protein L24
MAKVKLKVKTGDSVEITAGKDAGKRGKVVRVIPEKNRVVVEKLNMIKRHTKPRPAPRSTGGQGVIPGGVIEREAPISAANVSIVCPDCGPTRVGYRVTDAGDKVRVCRKCDKDLDR